MSLSRISRDENGFDHKIVKANLSHDAHQSTRAEGEVAVTSPSFTD
jgi:hypothetical protein